MLKQVQLFVGGILQVQHVIAGFLNSSYELVQLQVDGFGFAVLRVLDKEHHQEGDDRGAGVYGELPGVGKPEKRATYNPGQEHEESKDKSPWGSSPSRNVTSKFPKKFVHLLNNPGWQAWVLPARTLTGLYHSAPPK